MKETILVTGATGFLGSHLVHALVSADYQVVALRRDSSDCWRISDVVDKIKFYYINEIERAFIEQHIDVVIHTACCYGRKNEGLEQVIQTNLVFGMKLLDCSKTSGVDAFFNTGTCLPNSLNAYSLSKSQFLDWLKLYSNKFTCVNLKPEHMYGKKDDVSKFVPWFIEQLKNNAPEIRLTKGVQMRDFIYVSDVVAAFILLLKKRKALASFSEFYIGTGDLISVYDFVNKLHKQYVLKNPANKSVLNFGAVPLRDGELMTVNEDVSLLKSFGWEPLVSLEEGIQLVLE